MFWALGYALPTIMMLPSRQRSQRMMFFFTLLSCLFLTNHGFFRPLPAYSRRSEIFTKEEENLHFDDFGDFFIGEQASAPPDPLLNRIREFKEVQVRKDTLLAKNWKTGNWKVRGFSLDKEDPDSAVHVSRLHESLTPNQVIVGRTDGSVCFVTLGTEYLTQFVAKLTAQETGNSTISIESQLVRNDKGMNSEILVDSEGNIENPFQVELQFKAHDNSIVAMEENDDYLFTASQGSGEIRVWEVESDKVIPHATLTDAHSDTVVALSTLSYKDDENLLFSASCDGSLALWDVDTGDMVYKCQMMQDEEASPIVCADVDQSRSIIYLGMATGHVIGYNVEDMIKSASTGGVCPVPGGRFMAHEGGVTAVKCAGEGTLARSKPGASSSILLTGGSDGIVKQWEIMSRKQDSTSAEGPSIKLEHWPRMATQRMQRRAHLFKGHDDAPITALASIDASKFLSAGVDGTVRAWNPATGKCLFSMDGFTETLSSLCLQEDMYLITDGMKEFVCLHDFDVAQGIEDGYELEW